MKGKIPQNYTSELINFSKNQFNILKKHYTNNSNIQFDQKLFNNIYNLNLIFEKVINFSDFSLIVSEFIYKIYNIKEIKNIFDDVREFDYYYTENGLFKIRRPFRQVFEGNIKIENTSLFSEGKIYFVLDTKNIKYINFQLVENRLDHVYFEKVEINIFENKYITNLISIKVKDPDNNQPEGINLKLSSINKLMEPSSLNGPVIPPGLDISTKHIVKYHLYITLEAFAWILTRTAFQLDFLYGHLAFVKSIYDGSYDSYHPNIDLRVADSIVFNACSGCKVWSSYDTVNNFKNWANGPNGPYKSSNPSGSSNDNIDFSYLLIEAVGGTVENSGRAFDFAKAGYNNPEKGSAYAFSSINWWADDNWIRTVHAHEIGHLMNGRHEKATIGYSILFINFDTIMKGALGLYFDAKFSDPSLGCAYLSPCNNLQVIREHLNTYSNPQTFLFSGSLSGSGSTQTFTVVVKSGAKSIRVIETGPNGADFDIYGKLGSTPTTTSYDFRGFTSSSNEDVTFPNPGSGTWYIMVRSWYGSGSFTLKVIVTY
jgi:hypothetical protein